MLLKTLLSPKITLAKTGFSKQNPEKFQDKIKQIMSQQASPKKTKSAATAVGHKNLFTAIATALIDRFNQKGLIPPLDTQLRIDGKTCLVTGANSGLGKAVATQLAARGGHVIMACRSGIPAAGEDVKRDSGNSNVEMMHVDLADLDSINTFCDQLAARQIRLDIVVFNAGLMPLNARKSPQGFELMFAVHFLANRLLMKRWLADGVIAPLAEKSSTPEKEAPRIIFVSSETHHSSDPIDFNRFGEFSDYGLKDGIKQYGKSKLHMCTFASELSRRLNTTKHTSVAVHSLCPGPIASNIARESPALLKPLMKPIMRFFFRPPDIAAEPVMYLACASEMGTRSGVYLHMMREKPLSADASDPQNGKLLWDKSEALLKSWQEAKQ